MSEKNQQIALVTGASRGIGFVIATALSQAGYTVVGTATSESSVASMQAKFKSHHIEGLCLPLDLADAEAPKALLDAIKSHFDSSPSILINNAGITQDGLLMRMSEAQWRSVQSVNLDGTFRMMKTFARPMMRKKFGRMINLSSIVAFTGNMGQANYVAAKAGVIGLTKVAALEFAGVGITVNAIAPGFIETDMTSILSDEQKTMILGKIPLKRMGKPDEIASVVRFLCDHAYITGQTIHVNGGMYFD